MINDFISCGNVFLIHVSTLVKIDKNQGFFFIFLQYNIAILFLKVKVNIDNIYESYRIGLVIIYQKFRIDSKLSCYK